MIILSDRGLARLAVNNKGDEAKLAAVMAFSAKLRRQRPEALDALKVDPYLFATSCLKTKNEDTKKIERFPRYEYLEKLVFPKMAEPGNKQWEKSQRMMITLSWCAYYLWAWMTKDLFMGWMTSRNENKVDDGGSRSTWNSLMGIIRFMYDSMTDEFPWVVEHFLGSVITSANLISFLRMENPRTTSTIVGEAPTGGAGSGGGYTKALVDECALVPNMHLIHGNLMMAASGVCNYVSYPWGKGNIFWRIKNEPGHFGFEMVRVHMSLHPEKGKPENLEATRRTMTKRDFARRVDINYSESSEALVFGEQFSRERCVIQDLKIDVDAAMLWWDFGSVDATVVVIVQTIPEWTGAGREMTIRIKAALIHWNTNYEEVSKALHNWLLRNKYAGGMAGKMYEDLSKADKAAWHEKTMRIKCVGDPQVKQTEVRTGMTMQRFYREDFGFNIEPAPHHNTKATLEKIQAWLAGGRMFVDATEADEAIKTFEEWEWPTNNDGTRKPEATQPQHTRVSHCGKAIEYGFAELFGEDNGKVDGWEAMTVYDDRDESEVMGSIGLRTWH